MDRPNIAAGTRAALANLGVASKRIRRNTRLPEDKSFLGKIPQEFGEHEANVAFGVGTDTGGGSGTASFNLKSPRACILRRLFVDAGNVRGRVTSIEVAADKLLIGPSMPISAFAANAVNSPEFDYWVGPDQPVQIDIDLDAAFTVDVGFAID